MMQYFQENAEEDSIPSGPPRLVRQNGIFKFDPVHLKCYLENMNDYDFFAKNNKDFSVPILDFPDFSDDSETEE